MAAITYAIIILEHYGCSICSLLPIFHFLRKYGEDMKKHKNGGKGHRAVFSSKGWILIIPVLVRLKSLFLDLA